MNFLSKIFKRKEETDSKAFVECIKAANEFIDYCADGKNGGIITEEEFSYSKVKILAGLMIYGYKHGLNNERENSDASFRLFDCAVKIIRAGSDTELIRRINLLIKNDSLTELEYLKYNQEYLRILNSIETAKRNSKTNLNDYLNNSAPEIITWMRRYNSDIGNEIKTAIDLNNKNKYEGAQHISQFLSSKQYRFSLENQGCLPILDTANKYRVALVSDVPNSKGLLIIIDDEKSKFIIDTSFKNVCVSHEFNQKSYEERAEEYKPQLIYFDNKLIVNRYESLMLKFNHQYDITGTIIVSWAMIDGIFKTKIDQLLAGKLNFYIYFTGDSKLFSHGGKIDDFSQRYIDKYLQFK